MRDVRFVHFAKYKRCVSFLAVSGAALLLPLTILGLRFLSLGRIQLDPKGKQTNKGKNRMSSTGGPNKHSQHHDEKPTLFKPTDMNSQFLIDHIRKDQIP